MRNENAKAEWTPSSVTAPDLYANLGKRLPGVRRSAEAADLQRAVDRIAAVEGCTTRGKQWFPHPFPARMRPEVAACAVRELSDPGEVVLDPMVGSGTVAFSAQALGRRPIGRDVDPLAVLLSRAVSTNATRSEVTRLGAEILASAKRRALGLRTANQFTRDLPDEDRRFLDYWFPEKAQIQLFALSNAIFARRGTNLSALAATLLSSLVISRGAGASMAMDLSRSRPHRVDTKQPRLPFEIWDGKVAAFARFYEGRAVTDIDAEISQGDARELDLKDGSVDAIVTSPPYLDAIDYLRTSKFSLIFMGAPLEALRQIRSESVGTQVGLSPGHLPPFLDAMVEDGVASPKRWPMLRRYLFDLRAALAESFRVLRPGGRALFVLGPSMLSRKTYDSVQVFLHLAREAGFSAHAHARRDLSPENRSLPPPNRGERIYSLNRRMTCEYYVVIGKPA
jgi:DNA modification methylase